MSCAKLESPEAARSVQAGALTPARDGGGHRQTDQQ
jgi:hypothetical protein